MDAARRWAANDKTFWGVSSTFDELPAGVYRCDMTNNGPILVKQRVETDSLLELPDDSSAGIIQEFRDFWKLSPEFRKRGFLCKRGFLLYGPPGSGKTSCLQILVKRIAEELDGIAMVLDHPQTAAAGLQMLRHIEPKRPLIAIMEDLDALIEKFGENEYLALLDGEAQVDNVVFVATTNYPERLDPRFTDRPSRFDTIRLIGMPSAAARRRYLEVKEPDLSPDELSDWVRRSDGFSIAHLKELIIAVRCFGQSLPDVVERLEEMHERPPRSTDHHTGNFGFIGGASLGREQGGYAGNGHG
jgi:SpoVK/Ycf46/Vps4 family AAA+-type ATPase